MNSKVFLIVLLAVSIVPASLLGQGGWLEFPVPEERPPEDEASREAGKKVYEEKCGFCHGLEGDGEGESVFGPSGELRINPRPRSFVKAQYKFRTTMRQYPTDDDLYRTISRGIPGTAMPAWDISLGATGLTPAEIWQTIYYIKRFAARRRRGRISYRFDDARERGLLESFEIPPPVPVTSETIAKGKILFEEPELARCGACHGETGRGYGELNIEDSEWEMLIWPTNLTRLWNYKSGDGIDDIYRVLTSGLISTMTAFGETFTDEERIYIAHYVSTLIEPGPAETAIVLTARKIDVDIPRDPSDELWDESQEISIRLTGQITQEPRLWTHSVNEIHAAALHNDNEIGWRLSWDDRENTLGSESNSTYPDGVAIQFPVAIPDGPRKPHFLNGGIGKPVYLWNWNTAGPEDGHQTVSEHNSTGLDQVSPQPDESQEIWANSHWTEGRWQVVLGRSLETSDVKNDLQFELGKLIPTAFFVWNGANGEAGAKKSVSSWYYVILEEEEPVSTYLFTVLTVVLAGFFELFLLRRRKNGRKVL